MVLGAKIVRLTYKVGMQGDVMERKVLWSSIAYGGASYMNIVIAGHSVTSSIVPTYATKLPRVPPRPHAPFLPPVPAVSAHRAFCLASTGFETAMRMLWRAFMVLLSITSTFCGLWLQVAWLISLAEEQIDTGLPYNIGLYRRPLQTLCQNALWTIGQTSGCKSGKRHLQLVLGFLQLCDCILQYAMSLLFFSESYSHRTPEIRQPCDKFPPLPSNFYTNIPSSEGASGG